MSSSDDHEMLYVLIFLGWEVAYVPSRYSEYGVDGWRWTTPHGDEYTEIGTYSELPSWSDEMHEAVIGMAPDLHRDCDHRLDAFRDKD